MSRPRFPAAACAGLGRMPLTLSLLVFSVSASAQELGGASLKAMKKLAKDMASPAGSSASLIIELDCLSAGIPDRPNHETALESSESGAARGGYCSTKFKKGLSIVWMPQLPETTGPFYAKVLAVSFKLSQIDLFITPDYPQSDNARPPAHDKGCPYAHVLEHERSHARAYLDITAAQCRALNQDLQALVKAGKFPAPENPWTVAPEDIEAKKAEALEAVISVIQQRREIMLKCSAQDRAAKDSPAAYCALYKKCDPWTWGAAFPDSCKKTPLASDEPMPDSCLTP